MKKIAALDEFPDDPLIRRLTQLLRQLAKIAPRNAQIAAMRLFFRQTEEEIAANLNLSTRTVKRDWHMASAWLHRCLNDPNEES